MNSSFVFEGNVTLEYSAGDSNREITLTEPPAPGAAVDSAQPVESESLENYVARNLGFPSNAEFDTMLQKIRDQRQSGGYVCGETDATRENVKLRITVEVLYAGINQ